MPHSIVNSSGRPGIVAVSGIGGHRMVCRGRVAAMPGWTTTDGWRLNQAAEAERSLGRHTGGGVKLQLVDGRSRGFEGLDGKRGEFGGCSAASSPSEL